MRRILSVVGTRPNFVKLAAIHQKIPINIEHLIVHTGQHHDKNLYVKFYKELGIKKPKYDINVKSRPSHEQIAIIFEKLVEILAKERPDMVIVYGDTSSSLAAAITARYLNIPICHIEAGIRCFDTNVPEELNRIFIDKISTLLLCPTKNAVINLNKEGITAGVFFTGDVMYDLFLKSTLQKIDHPVISMSFILATIHRQENTVSKKVILDVFRFLNNQGKNVLLPVHPRVKALFKRLPKNFNNITFIDPVNYQDLLYLISKAELVITDSGGIQKEAYWSQTPCMTLRSSTEWPETLKWGANKIISLKKKSGARNQSSIHYEPTQFGQGNAATVSIEIIVKYLNDSL